MRPEWWIARKEGAQMLGSRRGLFGLLAYSGLLSAFGLLLVSNTELSLLDHAQVVAMMTGTVMATGALIAVIFGSDAYAGEHERRTLLPLLCAPIRDNALLRGKALGLLLVWGSLFALAMPYLWAVEADGRSLGVAAGCLALFGTPVVVGFGFLAMAFSARMESVLGPLLSTVSLLVLAASPLLIGASLRDSIVGRVLDAVNPFAGALNTFDAVIIDGQGFSGQWERLALVTAWLILTFALVRHHAAKPRFF